MIKMQELKIGDYVLADYEGENWEGLVKELNFQDKEVCLETDVQDFWFKPEALRPIPLTDQQLLKLNFVKQENEDGTVKYSKGPFRVFLPDKNDFSNMEIWYREDRRHLTQAISVHQLQNHYHQMTKVELTRN
ncbi:MAG: hypothetical protein ABIN89_19560 [Chitinophagaceae bacterium]